MTDDAVLPPCQVRLCDLPPLDRLEVEWRELQARGQGSFFTSWDWIGPWLACLPPDCPPRLVRAQHDDGHLAGLAIVVERRHRRFGFLPVRAWHLHETGRADCDALTIEYNGCLTAAPGAGTIEQAMLLALMEGSSAPDELRVSGANALPAALPATLQMRSIPHLSFYVDLEAIRASGKDYLGFLKQRQRYLVRKSLKRLGEPEPLRLEPARTPEQARHFLAEMMRLHTSYWAAKGEPGAFGSEFQRRFHTLMVERGVPSGAVALLAAMRGVQVIGYFYYFCHGGWVHYYQSGIDYDQLDGSESPGLAAHALAIEHFRAAGFQVYDFMTGDLQYKRTLATHDMPLHWLVLQQCNAKMRLEDWLLRQAKTGRTRWRQWQEQRQQARRQRQEPPAQGAEATPESPAPPAGDAAPRG